MSIIRKVVCDSCLDAAYDEGVKGDLQDEVMRELGGEWVDHLCDQIESGGEIKCSCGCRSRMS